MYNNSATIERCLRSILEQDGVDFEIVVVDDDSSRRLCRHCRRRCSDPEIG